MKHVLPAQAEPADRNGFISGFAFEKQLSKQIAYLTFQEVQDSSIDELSIVLGSDWSPANLTNSTTPPAPPPVKYGPISGFAFEKQGSKQVVYMTNDGHIHELSIVLGDLKWSHADLMDQIVPPAPPAPPAVPGGSISGFAFEKQGSKQVV